MNLLVTGLYSLLNFVMFKSILLVSLIALWSQANIQHAGGIVQEKVLTLNELPADVKKQVKEGKLCLVLAQKNNVVTKGKLQYLKAYLVNNTSQTQSIRRADGYLANLDSEIFENGQWRLYQQSHPVFCGNSYWTQPLESGQALVIHYEYSPQGKTMHELRLRWGIIEQIIYSNSILVQK